MKINIKHYYLIKPESSVVTNPPLAAEPLGGKRKRMDDEGENTVKLAKKQRANNLQRNTSTPEPEPTKRGGRTRRSQRSKLGEKEEEAKASNKTAPVPADDSVIIVDELILGEGTGKKGELTNR